MSDDALGSTTVLLSLNPEYYSVWNYRRTILLHRLDGADDPARAALLAEDLALTQESMRTHPKVYWLWNHRRWCLERLPGTDKWRKELALVDVMLGMDPRNFMGWNYRRYVVAALASALAPGEAPAFPASLSSGALSAEARAAQLALAQEELQYTLRKIEANFSNFSAWHYRSKLLPRVWDALGLDDAGRAAAREEGAWRADPEFALLQQAMYTDPSDQSVWLYHSWLVGAAPSRATLEAQIGVIEELAALEPESKCAWGRLTQGVSRASRGTGGSSWRCTGRRWARRRRRMRRRRRRTWRSWCESIHYGGRATRSWRRASRTR